MLNTTVLTLLEALPPLNFPADVHAPNIERMIQKCPDL
jgi:hypothetical protein